MSAPHTVVFLGTPQFAVPCLRALVNDPTFKVVLAVSQKDKPTGRGQKMTPTAVRIAAEELGIPLLQPDNVNKELAKYLEDQKIPAPDFLVVVAYGAILQQPLLDLPRIAPVNVHGSLLPRWRGASPIEHTILNGDTVTGISIQRMVKTLDAGPLLSSASTEIGDREFAYQLRERLMTMAAELLTKTLKHPLKETPQDEAKATFCRKLSRSDGKADPTLFDAHTIDRMVRAFVPWPGVTITHEGKILKILESSLEATPLSTPLPCKDGTVLHLVSVQPEGKKAMSGRDWKNGLR